MPAGEIWDVVDSNGVPTGATHERGAPGWPAGRFHVVAATCVVDPGGSVLLSRRGPSKDFPGMWELPAGSALSGETSAQAAVRELREEVGLEVDAADASLVARYREDTALFDLHVVAAPPGQTPRPDLVEVSEVAWVAVSELDRRRSEHELAAPWEGRLEAFWTPLLAAIAARRTH